MIDKAQFLAEFEAKRAQHVPDDPVLVRRDEKKVSLLALHSLDDRRGLFFRHELAERTLYTAVVLELDVGESLCAIPLGKRHQSVDLLVRHAALSLDVDAADGASALCRRL